MPSLLASPSYTHLAETLTGELSGAEWQRMQTRWAAIGQYHRQLLLATPALIPDRLDRQRWLWRLLVARLLILAENRVPQAASGD